MISPEKRRDICIFGDKFDLINENEIGIYGRYELKACLVNFIDHKQNSQISADGIFENQVSRIVRSKFVRGHLSRSFYHNSSIVRFINNNKDTYYQYIIESIAKDKNGQSMFKYARCKQTMLLNCNNKFELLTIDIDGNINWELNTNIKIDYCDNIISNDEYKASDRYCALFYNENFNTNTSSNQFGYCINGINQELNGFYSFSECQNWFPIYKKSDNSSGSDSTIYLQYDLRGKRAKILKIHNNSSSQTISFYNIDDVCSGTGNGQQLTKQYYNISLQQCNGNEQKDWASITQITQITQATHAGAVVVTVVTCGNKHIGLDFDKSADGKNLIIHIKHDNINIILICFILMSILLVSILIAYRYCKCVENTFKHYNDNSMLPQSGSFSNQNYSNHKMRRRFAL